MRLALLLLGSLAICQAQTVSENYACNHPASISAASVAVVTCSGPHGWNKWASDRWAFTTGTVPDNASSISIVGSATTQTYTFVTSVNNAVPNQVQIQATIWDQAAALAHAVNNDGVGSGTLYSSATAANPDYVGGWAQDHTHGFVDFVANVAGTALQGKSVTASTGAAVPHGGWTYTTTQIVWNVIISGGTNIGGGSNWTSVGTNQTPRLFYARYVSPTSFQLYANATAAYGSTANGPYCLPPSGPCQNVSIVSASNAGAAVPLAYTGESWSPTATITSDPFFAVNLPGCPDSSHELECAQAYRIPEVAKYTGNHQTTTSVVVSGGVATITLSAALPTTLPGGRPLLPLGSFTLRNIADTPGLNNGGVPWTHTTSLTNAASGTTLHHLVKFALGTSTVTALTNDRGGAMGIVQSGAGTSGTAVVGDGGLLTCSFDGTATAGHWVTVSTYDDRCHDVGASGTFTPSPEPIGVVQTGGTGAGDYTIWWNGLNRAMTAQTVNGDQHGNGITVITVNVPGYPNGTYASSVLPGYNPTYNFLPLQGFVAANITISPYIYYTTQASGLYYFPGATVQSQVRDQSAWTTATNRIEFYTQWGVNLPRCNTEDSTEMGTYQVAFGSTNEVAHGYHQIDFPVYAGQWRKLTVVNGSTHGEGLNDTTFNHPIDEGIVGGPYVQRGLNRGYFQGMVTHYFDMHGILCQGTSGGTSGETILISPFTYYTSPAEPDELVNTRSAVWAPNRFQSGDTTVPTGTQGYDLDWFGARNYPITYEVRYLTSGSVKTAGFSNALCQNGTTTCTSADRKTTNGINGLLNYQSAPMAQASNIWWAIKPISVPIIAASTQSGQNPTWLITPVDMHMSVGDHIAVPNSPGVIGIQTSTAITGVFNWKSWYFSDPVNQYINCSASHPTDTCHWVVSNVGGLVNINTTSGGPHGFHTGQTLQYFTGTAVNAKGTINGTFTITVTDINNFTLDGSSYATLCPSGCQGGSYKIAAPGKLANIVSTGSICTANLTEAPGILTGWQIYVWGSTDNVHLTPGALPGIGTYTVTGVSGNSFTFNCAAPSGTYASDFAVMNGSAPEIMNFGVQAFPAVALATPVAGSFTTNGTLLSTEDNKNFAEIAMSPPSSAPTLTVTPNPLAFSCVAGTIPASQNININATNTTLTNWTLTELGGSPWLSESPTSGVAAGTSSVSVDCTSLTAGPYSENLLVASTGIANSPVSVPVSLTVTPSGGGGGTCGTTGLFPLPANMCH